MPLTNQTRKEQIRSILNKMILFYTLHDCPPLSSRVKSFELKLWFLFFFSTLGLMVNFKSVLFCTKTGYFLPFFSSLLKKREEEKENEVAKPVLNLFFFMMDLKFDSINWKHQTKYTRKYCTVLVLQNQHENYSPN